MRVSRQEYQSGLPCLAPEDLLDPETELMSPALQVDSLPPSHQWLYRGFPGGSVVKNPPANAGVVGSIPWTEEPGGVQSMGSPRVGHD